MFAAKLFVCEGDGSAGMRSGEVWLRIWVVHVVQVFWLVQVTRDKCGERCRWSVCV